MDSINDSVTKLNTQLNKSMVLMEDAVDIPSQNHKRKSITINTETQPLSATNSPAVKSRKSILKKSDKSFDEDSTNNGVAGINGSTEELNNVTSQRLSSSISVSPRPRTLQEITEKEMLEEENICCTFSLEDISDNEDIWIMDLPRSIDPQELCGQMISLEDKSKFKIKDERYCMVAQNTSYNVTCVFNSEKTSHMYKTVNIKPAGVLSIRKKLSGAPDIKPVSVENFGVQFPNLKTRHPLFGVIRERKKKSRKHSLSKIN
ncbi:hypothetical protein EAG_03447 [Camponotus floridanus]|uniref:Uncharacterized protein n=1 Tax=Camponotus floridanus TaxID=104421 RepID=E2AHI6_CAMFO|nr:uncharacterized protein LOC105252462 [Camponotus floridanus]EFN67089.1 hypothetical protein EAG_03447 [Camponotus floridanus]